MLKYLWVIFAGAIAGVVGGMGMGGGTILVPLLSIFYSVEQHTCQAINLISFIPMAICALVIHVKNGLVEKKGLWLIIIPSVALSALFSWFSKGVNGEILKRVFGWFLLVLSVFQFFSDKLIEKLKNTSK